MVWGQNVLLPKPTPLESDPYMAPACKSSHNKKTVSQGPLQEPINFHKQTKSRVLSNALCCIKVHIFHNVIHFEEASGRFCFHFLEVFSKCIDYIRILFIHFLEISKFW